MGSRQKAKQFLEASETHKHHSNLIDYTLTYFIKKAEKEGRSQFAADLRRTKEDYKEDFNKALEITEEVYCEIFSDEELDDLMMLHSNPAIKKLRDLTSGIMNKVLEKYSLVSGG
jgi:hypothetical protein